MARIRTEKVVFTFHTTTQAIFMEKCCKEAGAAGRLIPVPRQISSGCGMAWCAQAPARPALEELIQEKGVETEAVYELLL